MIGVRGQYGVTDRIKLRGSLELFGIDTGDVSGHLNDFNIAADYGFGNRFAVGLAYNYVAMDIDASEGGSGFRGALDWGYSGWLLYLNMISATGSTPTELVVLAIVPSIDRAVTPRRSRRARVEGCCVSC